MDIQLSSEAEMEQFARSLANKIQHLDLVTLRGDLGAGKTTLVRAMLREFGHTGKVKSPTYALVESYTIGSNAVHHFDLYRISDPEELEFLGFSDYCQESALLFIEWPEKAEGALPEADLDIKISYADQGRKLELNAFTPAGEFALSKLDVLDS